LAAVVAIIAYKKRDEKHKPDYYTFFVMGLIWMIFGIFEFFRQNYSVFFMMGLVFMLVGLYHKEEWKKNHATFDKLSKDKKKFMIISLVLGLIVFLGVLLFYFRG